MKARQVLVMQDTEVLCAALQHETLNVNQDVSCLVFDGYRGVKGSRCWPCTRPECVQMVTALLEASRHLFS